MNVAVHLLLLFTLRFLYCLGKDDFLSMILFLIKTSFYHISNSFILLAVKIIKAAKLQNNGGGIVYLGGLRKML